MLSLSWLGSVVTDGYFLAGLAFVPISLHRFYGGHSLATAGRLVAVLVFYALLLAALSVFALFREAWALTR